MLEQGLHAGTQGLVVTVDGGPDLGLAAHAGAADAGEDRGDNVVAEGEQRADGAGGVWRDVVAAGSAGFVDELLAAELAQVVGGLPGGVAVLPGDLADLSGVQDLIVPPGPPGAPGMVTPAGFFNSAPGAGRLPRAASAGRTGCGD